MKSLSAIPAILAVALLAAGPLAAGQDGTGEQAQTEFALVAHTEDSGGYFTLDDDTAAERNPDLVVPPGEEITVTLRANDSAQQHNFCVEMEDAENQTEQCSEFVTMVDEEVEYTFTAPESGSHRYYCSIHEGMEGSIVVQEEEDESPQDPFDPEDPADPVDPGDEPEEEPTPAPALIGLLAVLAFAGLFAVRRRR